MKYILNVIRELCFIRVFQHNYSQLLQTVTLLLLQTVTTSFPTARQAVGNDPFNMSERN